MPRTSRENSEQQAGGLPAGAPLVAARAGLFTLVSLALGVASHHLVSGQAVPWPTVGAAAGLLFAVGLCGARRPRSLASITAACLAAQAVLHGVLGGLHFTHPAVAMPGHGHGSAPMSDGTGLLGIPDAWHVRMQHSLTITVAHVLVATAVAVAMHRADTACWSLTTGSAGAVARVVAGIVRMFTAWGLSSARRWADPPPRLRVTWERSPPKISVLADVVVRRGPPLGFGTA